MASISTDTSGNRKIQFSDGNGQRKIVRIGKLPMKAADVILAKIEALLEAKLSCRSLAPEVAEWVGKIPDVLAKRLVAVGLIAPREKRQGDVQTVDAFIDQYIEERVDLKPSTVEQLRQVQNNLRKFLGDKLMLREFTPGHADAFKASLASKLADNSVRRNLGRCRQFFEAALRKRLLESNPFAHIKGVNVKGNAERFRFVTLAEIKKVIDAAPDAQWRLIIALARFGGLRTPSETLALKWSDIDWEHQRIRVPSPKTAHVGKSSREIPLFPELLSYLQDAEELAADGTEYVVTRYRDATQNLRTTMLKIIRRAGLEPWERLFHNLRATRQTELAKTYPAHVVCGWMGNSEAVAGEHYLHTTDADFQKATHSAAEMSESGGTVRPAVSPEMQKPRHFRGVHSLSDT
ncbi:MAG: tyrosine-type recombinase/integrase [Planctomycetaceae bacterium]